MMWGNRGMGTWHNPHVLTLPKLKVQCSVRTPLCSLVCYLLVQYAIINLRQPIQYNMFRKAMLSMTMNDTDRNKEFTQPPGPHLHSIPSFYSVPQTLQSF